MGGGIRGGAEVVVVVVAAVGKVIGGREKGVELDLDGFLASSLNNEHASRKIESTKKHANRPIGLKNQMGRK